MSPIKFINIIDAEFELFRDYNKEYLRFVTNKYSSVGLFDKSLENGRYPPVIYRHKDNLGYIKIKNKNKSKDLWLYDLNGRPAFRELFCSNGDFVVHQPVVCWIEYLRDNTFIIFRPLGNLATSERRYLKYIIDNANNSKPLENRLKWMKDAEDASVFSFDKIMWQEYHSENVNWVE